MKKIYNILLIVSIVIVLIFCILHPKTNEFGAVNLERAIDNVVIIDTIAKIFGEDKLEVKDAIAIPIGNGLVVALSHATKTEDYITQRIPLGYIHFPRMIVEEKYFINYKEIELIGRKNDISLFRANIPQVFPYKFGNSDKLRVGDKLAMIGYSHGMAIMIKQGVVALPNFSYSEEAESRLLVNIVIASGDSGSPVLTYQNGSLKIVGIVVTRYLRTGLGTAFSSNYVQKMIDEILRDKL